MKSLLPLAAALAAIAASQAIAHPITVQSCDRTVRFDRPPKAAVSNDVNLTEIMLALGLSDRMVGYSGVSGWKTLDETLRKGVAELPELSPKYPSKEILLGAGADFFFAGWNYGMRLGGEVTPETLAPLGIAVYELTESCAHVMQRSKADLKDLYGDMLNLGKIFGIEERAEALVGKYRAEVEQITASQHPLLRAPRVFIYDSGEDAVFTAGRYAMPTALIETAGGINIMEDLERSWAEIGWDTVIDRNPEVIVIVNYGEVTAAQKIAFLENNPALAGIDAVRNQRYVILEYVEATPGPRNISAIRKLATAFREN
ncbi:MAG: ABC transporter substrate-binding protein [Pseudorhodobacter sp.]